VLLLVATQQRFCFINFLKLCLDRHFYARAHFAAKFEKWEPEKKTNLPPQHAFCCCVDGPTTVQQRKFSPLDGFWLGPVELPRIQPPHRDTYVTRSGIQSRGRCSGKKTKGWLDCLPACLRALLNFGGIIEKISCSVLHILARIRTYYFTT